MNLSVPDVKDQEENFLTGILYEIGGEFSPQQGRGTHPFPQGLLICLNLDALEGKSSPQKN